MHLYLYCICICIFFLYLSLARLPRSQLETLLLCLWCVPLSRIWNKALKFKWNQKFWKGPTPFSSPVPWLQDWWAVLCVLQPWHHPFMPGPQWIMTQNMQILPKEGFMIYGKKAVRCQNWIKTCPFPDHWVISQGRKLPQSQIDIDIYIYILIVRLILLSISKFL